MSLAGTATVTAPAPASADGMVYDLGYAPHEGPRLGRRAAVRAMFVDGTRRALGLRRKPATKVLPWALIAILLSSFWLPGPFALVALLGPGVFYGLAMLDRWVPEGSAVKRVSSPRWTFTVLMAAALCAPFALPQSADRVWKQTGSRQARTLAQ